MAAASAAFFNIGIGATYDHYRMSTPSGSLSGKTFGRYRIGPLLGRGGMGDVYRADDTELLRGVAIKVLPEHLTGDADRLARFIQEARAASALNHPHLVSIYEVGESRTDDRAVRFIAMELVQGETLRQVLDARRVGLPRLLEYLGQAADALGAAHAAGIVHRDLKPENLMVADGGYVKVLDFGLAKLRTDSLRAGADANQATQTSIAQVGTSPGVVMGTAGYMSPEQAQGLPADHRSDIFSFGCILYEAATGSRPFTGTSAVDTLHKIINDHPPSVAALAPSTPTELNRIVRKCLAKSPDDRYQSMKDVAIDVRELRREMASGSSPSVATAAARPRTRSVGAWLGAGIVGLALLGAAGWYWTASRPATPISRGVLNTERITTSGNVIDAVISSDGKYIAYVESASGRQSLWYRQTAGGRPLQLVESDGGFWGITFSKDGTAIYYAIKSATEPLGTLFSIPVLGGSPRRILSGIDSSVTFSPDGRRLAYLRVEPAMKGASSLVIAGVDGQDPRPLVTKHPPEFFAPGFFVAPSWSPDGRYVAASVRDSAAREARLSLFSTSDGRDGPFTARYADVGHANWLPDGSAIVFAARERGMYGNANGGQLLLQPFPAGEVRRITNDLLEYRTSSITADSKTLLTVAYEATSRLWVAGSDGRDARRLSDERALGAAGVAWSHDGTRIFYFKAVSSQQQLWTMAADGSDTRELITKVRPGGVAVSPKGEWIVYVAERDGGSGIWRARPDGSSQTLLTAIADPAYLTIAPDGREVYFTSLMQGAPGTYRVPIDGGTPALVATDFERAAPSPDGRLLAGIFKPAPEAGLAIGIIDAATGKPVHVIPKFSAPTGSGNFGWLPDGKTILYTTSERTNIWKQPATGGRPEQLTNLPDQWVVRFALSPDGKTILMSRGSALRDAVLLTNFR
jgi:eukaryotic-like serine/threonine-protein kinase